MQRTVFALTYLLGLGVLWKAVTWVFSLPHFILPPPERVLIALVTRAEQISGHALTTATEIVAGLLLGGLLGIVSACLMAHSRTLHRLTMPVLVVSQALPVFAIAPLLMLWLGYGFASKLAMTTLIVFFPVTAAALAGFRSMPDGWQDTLTSFHATSIRTFWVIRVPLAVPHALSGLKIAASVAPIGAVVGEWVGSSSGLGYLMLHANGRGQTDLMFAALLVLCVEAILVWAVVNRIATRFDHYRP
jgi:putative hydroxymethylpyrimidine transport system permease protein